LCGPQKGLSSSDSMRSVTRTSRPRYGVATWDIHAVVDRQSCSAALIFLNAEWTQGMWEVPGRPVRLRIRHGVHAPPPRFTQIEASSHSPKATRSYPSSGLPSALEITRFNSMRLPIPDGRLDRRKQRHCRCTGSTCRDTRSDHDRGAPWAAVSYPLVIRHDCSICISAL
jgi:hypothetical protein